MVMSNPRAELPEDAPVIDPQDGAKHGYYGVTPDTEDDYIYTVAGVTSHEPATSSKSDASKPDAGKPASRPTTSKDSK